MNFYKLSKLFTHSHISLLDCRREVVLQVSCSDVRERFHLFALLFVVVVQTMKEYGWREESFWSLAPDCLLVLGAEILVDW